MVIHHNGYFGWVHFKLLEEVNKESEYCFGRGILIGGVNELELACFRVAANCAKDGYVAISRPLIRQSNTIICPGPF